MRNYNPNTIESKSQKERIKEALMNGATITPLDALRRFGTMKLTTRVSELIQEGFPVQKEWVTTPSGKRVMSYKMQTVFDQ